MKAVIQKAQIPSLRKQLDTFFKESHLPSIKISDLLLAADELATNPFKHNEGEKEIIFFANIYRLDGTVNFTIRSWGYEQEYNQQKIREALANGVIAPPNSEHKRGLNIIKGLFPGTRFIIEVGKVAAILPMCPLLGQSYQSIQPAITVLTA